MLTKVNLVVFDFDGTLSAKDSNVAFVKYCFRRSVRPWLFLPIIIVGLIAKLFNPGGIWWREASRRFITADMVKKFATDFIKQHKMERFGWSKDQVAAERAAGNKVILISAGPDYLIPFLASDIKFDAVICSVMDSTKPWKFKFMCWGKNKVHAMDEWARQNKVLPRLVKSYSDSKTDMPMMDIAEEQVWINPHTGSRKF
ncbi:MAG: haloacid dehalogenase-like hydrolase [Rickettsiales bacterium]|jgi:phosphoserine phosphatase|nr:haloacid dehalogenase-like hydrolase [Rickettsiales bacterium]